MSRPNYLDAVARTNVLAVLAEYDPHIAGTPPLGLDLPTSDIDVLCHAPDSDRFTSAVWAHFGACADFRIWQWSGVERPVVATFWAEGWSFELFGHAQPVVEQAGWRHILVERRLLELGGDSLAAAVMALRKSGLKTEPAFAAALMLEGEPYQLLLDLHALEERALLHLVQRAGHAGPPKQISASSPQPRRGIQSGG